MQAGCQVCYTNTVLGRLYRQENLNTKSLKMEDKIMGISPHTWHRTGETSKDQTTQIQIKSYLQKMSSRRHSEHLSLILNVR